MKMYLKVIGGVHVILAFLKLILLLKLLKGRWASGYWFWCSSGSSTSTHEHMAKNKATI